MRAILSDNDAHGHVIALYRILQSSEWAEFWAVVNLLHLTLIDAGLDPRTSDADIWRMCQREEYILVTGNRNKDGPDSLEAVLRAENNATCLPVFTIADMRELMHSRDYATRAALRLLDYLLEIDKVRGAGRLFLP